MSNDTRPRPEIRFPGFTEAWEQSKLGEVAEYYDGTHQTPKYTKSGIPFVSVENIQNILGTGKYISEDDFETNFKIKPKKNDILMTRITAGIIGDTAIITNDSPLAYYVSLALIRSKKINFLYLEKYINTPYFKHELHKRIIHTAFPKKINLVEIGQCSVSYPKKESEQKQIGQFFIQLDKSIALHQRKLDLLKETKKGFLQKMFPKNGAKVPEIRFPGFTEDWEQRKLGELGKTQSGIGFPDAEQGGSEGIPFFKVSDMNNIGNEYEMRNANHYVSNEQIERKKWKPIKDVPAIIFAKVGAAIMLNRKRLVTSPFLIDNNTMAYLFNNTWDIYFGKILFETINLPRYSQVGALPSYNSSDIDNISVKVPVKDEQQKIGTFFKQLDDTIALHQRKLDLLKETKKGFLQKMFV